MKQVTKTWIQNAWGRIKKELRWFKPGMGVKRWIGLILIGTTLLGLGFAVIIIDLYRTVPDTWYLPILSAASLRVLERPIRAIIFGASGLYLILMGTWGLNRTLLRPFLQPGKPILDTVTAYRLRERGPKIVVIGGGNGLAALLRGLKEHTHRLTAIVTVADDGGSSGELRKNIGILPPGDIRNCLAAMSDDEALMTQVFQYRFGTGSGLKGHSLGNLFITALAGITGSFEEAIAESGRVLAVKGQVLPSTLHDVHLVADLHIPGNQKDVRVKGESLITKTQGEVKKVWLDPSSPLAFPPSLQALLSADLIIIGPGSLYTSIIPNLLVPDLVEAVRASRALKFYVCNVATQPGETDGFSSKDHLETIEKYIGGGLFDLLISNDHYEGELSNESDWVRFDPDLNGKIAVYTSNLVDQHNPWRHDSNKLAQTVMDIYFERTGPLSPKTDS